MARIRCAAAAVLVLLLGCVANASASSAPIVRLAGTGSPTLWAPGTNALATKFLSADGMAWAGFDHALWLRAPTTIGCSTSPAAR